ncbi:MAG: hypothetical protein IJ654_03820 [Bacteroidales bacterium]|nr:hypothetical protein [Bacteroidales bacterium]
MDKKQDILDREDLRRSPYSVPEGYFAQLQERLRAIPSQQAEVTCRSVSLKQQHPEQSGSSRSRIRSAMSWAVGVAAALALGVFAFRGGDRGDAMPGVSEVPSYEQYAYADLIPYTEPYLYYSEEEAPAAADPAEEEMIDYLMQYQNY